MRKFYRNQVGFSELTIKCQNDFVSKVAKIFPDILQMEIMARFTSLAYMQLKISVLKMTIRLQDCFPGWKPDPAVVAHLSPVYIKPKDSFEPKPESNKSEVASIPMD